jgi:predicted enzyme involved in methoxymalonyl-ACP biosynthesis
MIYKDVLNTRKENPYRQWCVRKDGVPIDDPKSARTRYSDDFFHVNNSPKFTLKPGCRIYTIGSCFARNVERELANCGFILPTLELKIDKNIYVTPPYFPHTILNKYTAHSIANEIERAIGSIVFDDDGLIEVGNSKWYDPQTSHTNSMSREKAVETRSAINENMKSLTTSDALILTLGLTETWVDQKSNAILNQMNAAALGLARERMNFFNSTVEESFNALDQSLSALKNVCPNIKIIITVSPVPLTQTFTVMDVASANCYSKSVLRCTSQMLCDKYDFIDYFPSFEMVTNSPRSLAWHSDQTHVNMGLVQKVIKTFANRYVGE